MKLFLQIFLFLVAFVFLIDSARVGGGARFSSSRYSSSYRSSYRVSYRSYRSYRSYSSRYYRSYRYYSYAPYRVSSSAYIGMGGLTVNKQALLIAGSVYIAYSMRPKFYTSSGYVISQSVNSYAVCTGWILYNAKYNNATYVPPPANETGVWGNLTAVTDPAENATGSFNSSIRQYRYFVCPSDLSDGLLEADDTFCCGPPGFQLCCSLEDFNEQLESTGVEVKVGLTIPLLTAGMVLALVIYLVRRRRRAIRRAASRAPAVIFVPVPSGDVNSSGANGSRGDGEASVKFIPPELPPSMQQQPPEYPAYPIYPPTSGADGQMQLPQQPPPPYPGLLA